MKRTRVLPDVRPKQVYVIIRVYDLFADETEHCIFVDPWRLNGNVLEFTVDKWKAKTNFPDDWSED